jgi:hypothetical protein
MLIMSFNPNCEEAQNIDRTFLTVQVKDGTFRCYTVGNWFGRMTRLGKIEHERENLPAERGKDNANIAEHQQEKLGTNGNSDTSDADA